MQRGNTFESHIRRSTPVGIFDNRTPEGAYDLTGNVFAWTRSIFDPGQFPYPYRADDGRENETSSSKRVLRGGSYTRIQEFARAMTRYYLHPAFRLINNGFRLCRPG